MNKNSKYRRPKKFVVWRRWESGFGYDEVVFESEHESIAKIVRTFNNIFKEGRYVIRRTRK